MVPHAPTSTAVVVSELFPPAIGGSAALLGNIYSRMKTARVTVLTDDKASAGAIEAHRSSGIRVVCRPIGTRLWGLMAPGSIGHHWRVAHEIRALCHDRPVLVHAVRALPEGLAALASMMATGVPYVCWSHGEDVSTALTSRELAFLMRRVYGRATVVMANSRNTATQLVQAGVKETKIMVVHPGVDSSRFRPDVDGREMRERLAPGADLLLLSVGRLQRRKGHDTAIEAVARLVPGHPGMRYVVVGDGPERSSLEALADKLGVRRYVRFVGELPDCDLPACYAACDIFVLPNRADGGDIEGFGLVFLEAAAAGKPAIGGNSGGVPEAIEDGVTGILVNGLDADEVATQIGTLAASADLRARIGAAGRARVLSEFTWEQAAATVTALHRGLTA